MSPPAYFSNMELGYRKKIKIIIYLILLLLGVLVALPLVLINIVARSIVWTIARVFRPDLESFITGYRAIFATNPHEPTLNIIMVLIHKGPLSVQTYQTDMEERVLKEKDSAGGKLLYEGLQQTWEGFLGYAFWKTDTNFDIKNHVREYDYQGNSKLGSTCTLNELQSVLGELYEASWDRSRSPWELLVKPNVVDVDGEVCSATIFRIDHVLADGYSILGIFRAITQSDLSMPEYRPATTRGFTLLEKLALIFKVPWDFSEAQVDIASTRQFKWTPCVKNEPLIACVSPIIPVELIKSVKNHFGVSYAAVIYSSVLGAIERAANSTGLTLPECLALTVVLPRLGHPMTGLAVHSTMIQMNLTLKASSSAERLRRVNKELKAATSSTTQLSTPVLFSPLTMFPMPVIKRVMEMLIDPLHAAVTIFPVTKAPEFYNGHEIKFMFAGVGTWKPLGINVATGGINNKHLFQISVNQSVFNDVKVAQSLGIYVQEEVQLLAEEIQLNKKCN